MSGSTEASVQRLQVSVYTVPTETNLESDGTAVWNSTTMVLVEATAGGVTGLGYTYSAKAAAEIIRETLAPLVVGGDAMRVKWHWLKMLHAVRNLGPQGVASMAVAAVDNALWDLKARLLGLPLCDLLGRLHDRMPVYGSGGFTNYSLGELERHCATWAEKGYRKVKIKVGRVPADDPARVLAARRAIGPSVELYTDANGAYARKQALGLISVFHREAGVIWFEEPVTSDDLPGLRLIRDQGPPGVDVAAGEYGYSADYFRAMLEQGAVDVIQADATRCAGISGFMDAAALSWSFDVPLSSHCAPAQHLHPCAAAGKLRHLEFFYDHLRIERLFFDGAPVVQDGFCAPDLTRPGLGLELKRQDAARFAV